MAKLPPPLEEQAETWREAIADACDEMGGWTSNLSEDEDEEFEEVFFGVYGFELFGPSYGIRETLSLPGEILSTNTETRQGNILIWEFQPTDFLWEDYVLQARSRIIYPSRILGAGVVVLVIVGAGGLLGLRRRQLLKGPSLKV